MCCDYQRGCAVGFCGGCGTGTSGRYAGGSEEDAETDGRGTNQGGKAEDNEAHDGSDSKVAVNESISLAMNGMFVESIAGQLG